MIGDHPMKRLFLWLALGAMAAACGGCSSETRVSPAPAWSLPDLDGKVVTSDLYKGKVVVIDFWATWCGPCKKEIPGYVRLQKKYAGDGLVIVGVSLDNGSAVVKKFVKQYGVDYPVVMGDDAVQKAFGGVDAYPMTFIIDREGMIRERQRGAVGTEEFERKLLAVLKPGGR
jgi:thiol-disulfide isomerase/thioredoxin